VDFRELPTPQLVLLSQTKSLTEKLPSRLSLLGQLLLTHEQSCEQHLQL
jgi:hypothetical protein